MTLPNNITLSSGLIIIKKKKILLLKPKGAPDYGYHSIPKGEIEINEQKKEAAIRETFEEVGIKIKEEQIDDKEYSVNYVTGGILTKTVYFFLVRSGTDSLPDVIPQNQLQADEVESAAFYSKKEAITLLFWRFRHLLFELEDLQ